MLYAIQLIGDSSRYWLKISEYNTGFLNSADVTTFKTKKSAEKAIRDYCIKNGKVVKGLPLENGFYTESELDNCN